MRRAPSLKLRLYAALTATGALVGLTLGHPEPVALGAPFAAYAVAGLALARRPEVQVDTVVERTRMLEGEDIEVRVAATADADLELALELRPGPGLQSADSQRTLWLNAAEPTEVTFSLRTRRWGAYRLGSIAVRARDRFGLIDYEFQSVALGAVRVFPAVELLRALIEPLELQATSGSRVSRERGEGTEFAEVRPFVSGDRLRRVNWRVTARRGIPYVSDRHPERNADVILFLDTFAEVGDTLTLAVRAAASLAAAYLACKDRVGVVGFGGVLSGLGPRLGQLQLYRIIDALLGSEVVFSYAHKDIGFVPRGMLPPKALVVGITPLIDERYINALLDLRARGFDVAVIDVSPVPFVKSDEDLARRVWLLRREALRTRLLALGAPVAEWRAGEPFQVPLAGAAALRRRYRQPVAG
jgi:uncharacterized protein (DUF58 family)